MDLNNLDLIINGDVNKTLTRKHLAERQRRARINAYLEEIQELTSEEPKTSNPVKLEKAEVLERAVNYLKQLDLESDNNNNSQTTKVSDTEIYKKGFTFCMSKLVDKVSESGELQSEAEGLTQYLNSFLHNLTTENESTESLLERQGLTESNMSYCTNNSAQSVQQLHGFNSRYDAKKKSSQSQHWSHDGSAGYTPPAPHVEELCQSQNYYRQDIHSVVNVWADLQMQYVQQQQQQQQKQQQQQQQQYETQGHQQHPNYNALQSIQNVYANFLQTESDGNSGSAHDQNRTHNELSQTHAVDLSEHNRGHSTAGSSETAEPKAEHVIKPKRHINTGNDHSENSVPVWRPW